MKLKLLVLVLALQCAWLLATTYTQERALRVGQLIMLETRPVDPRDLLRGDYVILSYKISDVPLSAFTPARTNTPADETTLYVALAPVGTNGFYEIMRASTEPLGPVAGQVLMQGKCRHWWGGNSSVRVEYGLERYYVSEGTGNPRGKLTVQAAVPKSGRATIKQVFLDGQPYAEAMKAQAEPGAGSFRESVAGREWSGEKEKAGRQVRPFLHTRT